MLKKLSLVFILFIFSSCNTMEEKISDTLYKKVTFLNQKNDSLSIEDILKLYKKGDFNIPMKNKVFYRLKGKESSWIKFIIPPSKTSHHFSIWNPFLEYSKTYTLNNGRVNSLKAFSLWNKNEKKWNYRFPSWKIEKSEFQTIIFVKIKDTKNKTSLKLLLQSEEVFNNFIAKDYSVISIQASFLLIIIFIAILLFLNQKKVNILWYGAYVFILIIEFLVHKGLDLQLGLTISPLFHSSKRLFLQNLGLTFALIFFIQFYTFNESTKKIKTLFKIITGLCIVFNIILLLQYTFDNEFISKILIWKILRSSVLFVLISHLYLVMKKVLPAYLGLGFTLPIIGFFLYAFASPRQDLTMVENFLIDNLFQLTITIEVTLILLYIIRQLVKSEFLAISLQKENLKLRTNFQDNISQIEQQERNKLLGNMHDSFGGYLEALKLRLLNKNENTPDKIQGILDAFYKEYRYLLNSLYSPKINSENFSENLIEFFNKLNDLTKNTIQHQIAIKNTVLSPEKCVHLYRIISETTTNALKHAKASCIYIKITKQDNNFITLKISDNGIGFDVENVNNNSYGLKNIKTRVKAMNGEIEINSIKNKGTNIIVSIPNYE